MTLAAALALALLPQAPLDARAYRADVEFLASDALEGRRAGENGMFAAARYLAARMQQIGLEPMGDVQRTHRDYLQRFGFGLRDLGDCKLSIESGGKTLTPESPDGWIPLVGSPDGNFEAEAVFAGYGITAPECAWDDYAGLDVRGKIAVVLRHEPFALDDSANAWQGKALTRHASFAVKAKNAADRGAVALAVIPDLTQFPDGRRSRSMPGKNFWKSLNVFGKGVANLGAFVPADSLDSHNSSSTEILEQVYWLGQAPHFARRLPIPSIYLAAEAAEAVLPAAAAEKEILTAKAPRSRALPGVKLVCQVRTLAATAPCANVVGCLRGSDPKLAEEFVVVGGHFDHVGKNAAGEVWNGADDNASGTAAVLALAEAFVNTPPKRSVLFVNFGAEEVALLGSFHFVENPPVPLASIAAMVNCDMIGRGGDEDKKAEPEKATELHEVLVSGILSSPIWDPIVVKANKGLGLTVKPDETFFDRSDQAAFYFKDIPVLFFNTGEHGDYHGPKDEASRLNVDKAVKVSTLAARCVQAVANLPAAPPFLDFMERNGAVAGKAVKGWMLGRTSFLERADF